MNGDIQQHIGLVWHVINRWYAHKDERDDLFQVGCVGLISAIQRFDPSLGYKFSTYAVTMIRGEIQRFIRDCGLLHIIRPDKDRAYHVRKHELEDSSPTVVAERLNCSIDEAQRALNVVNLAVTSLNRTMDENELMTFQDQIPAAEDYSVATVKEFLSTLRPREQYIVKLRMNGLPQAEIAERVGVSQAHVNRLLMGIRRKLKTYLESA